MAHEQVLEAFSSRDFFKLLPRHDRERTDVRAAQLGIVMMMVVVRTAPDAAGTQNEKAKDSHEHFRHARPRQNRVMLLIVVNHKHPHHQQTRRDAAHHFCRPMNIDDGPCERSREEKRGGQHMPGINLP